MALSAVRYTCSLPSLMQRDSILPSVQHNTTAPRSCTPASAITTMKQHHMQHYTRAAPKALITAAIPAPALPALPAHLQAQLLLQRPGRPGILLLLHAPRQLRVLSCCCCCCGAGPCCSSASRCPRIPAAVGVVAVVRRVAMAAGGDGGAARGPVTVVALHAVATPSGCPARGIAVVHAGVSVAAAGFIRLQVLLLLLLRCAARWHLAKGRC
jgi:hypothetical protein